MLATILVVLIIIFTLSYVYLKCNLMTSLTTVLAALFGTILAFSYYEKLSNLLIAKDWAYTWIQSVSFLSIFFFSFLLMRVLSDFLVGSNIEVGNVAKITASLSCGIISGVIIAGVCLTALGLSPVPPGKSYGRFPGGQVIQIQQPKKPIINADGIVVSLYSWISRGSLSTSKSFAVLHADYLTQTHLNRYALGEEVPSAVSPQAISLPAEKLKPVRTMDFPNRPNITVVRVGISGADIPRGGAGEDGNISFIPAQFRMILKNQNQASELTGSATSLHPVGVVEDGALKTWELNEVISYSTKDLGSGRIKWLDLAFPVPPGKKAVLLGFKQNALIELPKAAPSTPEIERGLGKKAKASQSE